MKCLKWGKRLHLPNYAKLHIVEAAKDPSKSLRKVAQDYGVYPSQIVAWRKNVEKLSAFASKITLLKGPETKGKILEEYVLQQIAVSNEKNYGICYKELTNMVHRIDPLFLLYPNSDNTEEKQMNQIYSWCRRVCERGNYSVRRPTHIAQNTEQNVDVLFTFLQNFKETVQLFNITMDCVCNMLRL